MFLEIDSVDPLALRIVLLKANHNTPPLNSVPRDTNAPSPFPDDLLQSPEAGWAGVTEFSQCRTLECAFLFSFLSI